VAPDQPRGVARRAAEIGEQAGAPIDRAAARTKRSPATLAVAVRVEVLDRDSAARGVGHQPGARAFVNLDASAQENFAEVTGGEATWR
jgi:hypothetical protein